MRAVITAAIVGGIIVSGAGMSQAAPGGDEVTVIWEDRTVEVDGAIVEGEALWVRTADVKRISGFELKPEGACIDEICVPVPREGEGALIAERGGEERFDLLGFARRLDQAVVADREKRVFGFGLVPTVRAASVGRGLAPDFELPDRNGKKVRLSSFRGRKVLLFTWASW